jgi:hypothetical protein
MRMAASRNLQVLAARSTDDGGQRESTLPNSRSALAGGYFELSH